LQRYLLLYIIFFSAYSSVAQPYISVRGDFSIDQRRGCRDLFVTATNINPGTDVILYQFEGRTTPVTNSSTHTYTTTGNYWLYQYIQGPTGEKVDSIFVEVLDPVVPEFELRSCNNNDVQLIITTSVYDYFDIDYGDGTVIQVPVNTFPPIHNYVTPGTYNVTVTGGYTTANNSCGVSSRSFTPVNEVQPAQFNFIQTLNDNDLIIDYTLAPNTISTLEVSLNSTTGFQKFKDLNQNTTRDTLRGLQLSTNVYCFRISSDDACSNFSAYSTELCSINLLTEANNNVNKIDWSTLFSTNHSNLELYRDGVLLTNFTSQPFTFNDSTVVCNINYCYQLIAYNSDGSRVFSSESCATATSTTPPSSVSNVSTDASALDLLWNWQVPPNENVAKFVLRSERGRLITETTDTQYRSTIEDLECINFEFTNACNNTSAISPSFCPLIINANENPDGSVTLEWSGYNGWQDGVFEYIVVIYDQNMVVTDSISVGLNTTFTDPIPTDNDQISNYRVYALPTEGTLMLSLSNTVYVERPPVISVPSSFTPNGDNLNDLLEVSGKYIQSLQLDILNRWGSLIYSTTETSWDGMVNGKKVAAGTYIYKVTVKDFIDKEHIRTGTVLILKD
jgi:gliding motility-associated-like protein